MQLILLNKLVFKFYDFSNLSLRQLFVNFNFNFLGVVPAEFFFRNLVTPYDSQFLLKKKRMFANNQSSIVSFFYSNLEVERKTFFFLEKFFCVIK